MQNGWGCNLVQGKSKPPQVDKARFEALVNDAVPGFNLFEMTVSGTTANECAVEKATNHVELVHPYPKCLFGMGCYVAGKGPLFKFSSCDHSAGSQLSIPVVPEFIDSDECRQQIVALPYFVSSPAFSESDRLSLEKRCLEGLNRKLLRAKIAGRPYNTILFELVLCGCGGELSSGFLKSLGLLLREYNMWAVVDEVMTGGRSGATMTLTQTTPHEFQNQVLCITMGKMVQCGLVLHRATGKPTEMESDRGISTEMSPNDACYCWLQVHKQLKTGLVAKHRQYVLTSLKIDEESAWGKGLLVFIPRYRPWVNKSLKNRLLPMLEERPLYIGPIKPSPWNRASVCKMLVESANKWLREMEDGDRAQDPINSCLVAFLLDTKEVDITHHCLMAYVGDDLASELAELERQRRRKDTTSAGLRVSAKTADRFFIEALGCLSQTTDLAKRTRVTKKRKLVYRLNRSLLVDVETLVVYLH